MELTIGSVDERGFDHLCVCVYVCWSFETVGDTKAILKRPKKDNGPKFKFAIRDVNIFSEQQTA